MRDVAKVKGSDAPYWLSRCKGRPDSGVAVPQCVCCIAKYAGAIWHRRRERALSAKWYLHVFRAKAITLALKRRSLQCARPGPFSVRVAALPRTGRRTCLLPRPERRSPDTAAVRSTGSWLQLVLKPVPHFRDTQCQVIALAVLRAVFFAINIPEVLSGESDRYATSDNDRNTPAGCSRCGGMINLVSSAANSR